MTTAKQMGKNSQKVQKSRFGKFYKKEMQRRSKVRDTILARLVMRDSQDPRIIPWLKNLVAELTEDPKMFNKYARATIYK